MNETPIKTHTALTTIALTIFRKIFFISLPFVIIFVIIFVSYNGFDIKSTPFSHFFLKKNQTTQTSPETEALPETKALPETRASSETKAKPETRASPQTQAEPETRALP